MAEAEILVIYYSFEGNTKFVAEEIARYLEADILRLKPKKDLKTHGFMKYFWGGRMVTVKDYPKLEEFDKNIEDYDIIILGTPVWAFTYTPALASLFKMHIIQNKKVIIFCTHEGGMKNALEKAEKMLMKDNNKVIAKNDFLKPLKNTKATLEKINDWIKEIDI